MTLRAGTVQSHNFLPGLTHGCRCPRARAFQCFPCPLAKNWIGSGPTGTRTGTQMLHLVQAQETDYVWLSLLHRDVLHGAEHNPRMCSGRAGSQTSCTTDRCLLGAAAVPHQPASPCPLITSVPPWYSKLLYQTCLQTAAWTQNPLPPTEPMSPPSWEAAGFREVWRPF